MTERKVERVVIDGDERWYVRGLSSGHERDQLLLHHIPYPQSEVPEVESPDDPDKMLGALYDLYQWHDGLHDGDVFVTPFGRFVCSGVHVLREGGLV